MKNRLSRRERGELALWRLILIGILGWTMRLVIMAYVLWMIWLTVTGGWEGWW